MRKKTKLLLCGLLAAVMLLASCGAPQAKDTASAGAPPASSADNKVVAEIDGQKFYYSDFEKWYKLMGSVSDDPKEILDEFISYEVELLELKAKGYLNLTSDEITKAQQDAQSILTSYANENYMTEEQALSSVGITKDELVELYKFNTAETNAINAIIGSVKPSEEQIKDQYDKNVEDDKETMENDPATYTYYANSGETVYFTPAGVRAIKRILIPIDEASNGAIQLLRDNSYDEQADILRDFALKKIEAEANKAADALKTNKLTFDQALEQYKDSDMPDKGYLIADGSDDLGADFTKKAMALSKVGDVSELFYTDEGYQIIQYAADKPQGPVNYDDVKDEIIEQLIPALQDEAWSKQIQQWKTAHKIIAYYDAMPTAEPAPSPEPYVTQEYISTEAPSGTPEAT